MAFRNSSIQASRRMMSSSARFVPRVSNSVSINKRGAMMTSTAVRALSSNVVRKTTTSSSNTSSNLFLTMAAVGAVAGYYVTDDAAHADSVNWDQVRAAIADMLDAEDYDDGSYAPLFLRLAWHASGTYSQFECNGGSNGGCMRFDPEKSDGANAGLDIARGKMEEIKRKFPGASYADIYTLAGVVAVEEMGGPKIDWAPGRTDAPNSSKGAPAGRLPDAARNADHIRAVFYRMGFNDREIVALSGAHALGRCHTDRSGFKGPWTRAPTTFSNEYFRVLFEEKWTPKKWNGPLQYENPDGDLMMLPTDMEMIRDDAFRVVSAEFRDNEDAFNKEFASAFSKLLKLGVPGQGDCKKGSRWSRWFGKN